MYEHGATKIYPGVEEATIKGNTWLGDMSRGALALAVSTQVVLTVTATLHFWLFKFGCTGAFMSVLFL